MFKKNEEDNMNYSGYNSYNGENSQQNGYGNQWQNGYGNQQYNGYNQQYQPNAYGNQQYNPYNQQYQPGVYGQPPYMMPKKKNTGKTVAITIGAVAGVIVLLFASLVAYFMFRSPDKKVQEYEETGNLECMIDACDIYDGKLLEEIKDKAAAEKHFEIALSDTKNFLRAFPKADCADYYTDDWSAYEILATDWLSLMLLNGQYEKYEQVFVVKMLEHSPTGTYYLSTYTLQSFVADNLVTFNAEQKQVMLKAFDALLEACRDDNELYMNLKEYYEFCECLGEYDRADEIEERIAELDRKMVS